MNLSNYLHITMNIRQFKFYANYIKPARQHIIASGYIIKFKMEMEIFLRPTKCAPS